MVLLIISNIYFLYIYILLSTCRIGMIPPRKLLFLTLFRHYSLSLRAGIADVHNAECLYTILLYYLRAVLLCLLSGAGWYQNVCAITAAMAKGLRLRVFLLHMVIRPGTSLLSMSTCLVYGCWPQCTVCFFPPMREREGEGDGNETDSRTGRATCQRVRLRNGFEESHRL